MKGPWLNLLLSGVVAFGGLSGGTPALSLPFYMYTSGSDLAAKGVTFTRASTATYFNSTGVLSTAAINAPRFDYDPTTLTACGLLIEESRTNILLNATLDGANLATQSVTVAAQVYTLSFYGTGTVTLSGVATGTLTGSGSFPTRGTLTFTPTAGTLTLTVSGTVQYAMCEAGTFATSFVPTGATSVTRAAETASITGAAFSSWYNQSEGTFVVDCDIPKSVNARVFDVWQDAANLMSVLNSPSGTMRCESYTLAGSSFSFDTSNLGPTTKIALAYKQDDFADSADGNFALTDTSGPVVPTPILLSIGNYAGAAGYALNGHIKSLVYYNTRKSDVEIKILSAPSIFTANPVGTMLYLAEGDSLTYGADGSSGQIASYAQLYATSAGSRCTFVNRGVSGSLLSDLVSRATADDAYIAANPGKTKYVFSVLIGSNEIGSATYYPSDASGYISALASYCDARRSAGWKVVVGTILPRQNSTAFKTWCDTVNAAIRTWNGVHADGIVDFASDVRMGIVANTVDNRYYYGDQVHPTADKGHIYLENISAPVIDAVTRV